MPREGEELTSKHLERHSHHDHSRVPHVLGLEGVRMDRGHVHSCTDLLHIHGEVEAHHSVHQDSVLVVVLADNHPLEGRGVVDHIARLYRHRSSRELVGVTDDDSHHPVEGCSREEVLVDNSRHTLEVVHHSHHGRGSLLASVIESAHEDVVPRIVANRV